MRCIPSLSESDFTSLILQALQHELAGKLSGAKRKISELQDRTAAMLTDAEQKSKKIARRAEKLPELAKFLQPFV